MKNKRLLISLAVVLLCIIAVATWMLVYPGSSGQGHAGGETKPASRTNNLQKVLKARADKGLEKISPPDPEKAAPAAPG
jgi:hypothetical protein